MRNSAGAQTDTAVLRYREKTKCKNKMQKRGEEQNGSTVLRRQRPLYGILEGVSKAPLLRIRSPVLVGSLGQVLSAPSSMPQRLIGSANVAALTDP